MNESSTIGLLFVLSFIFLFAVVISELRVSRRLRRLLLLGLALRVTGGLLYLYLIGELYGGGDYLLYFREGSALAESAADGGSGSLWDSEIWTSGAWWGTHFVARVTGLLLVVIGPTLPGAFIVFSLVSYVGIMAVGLAFHRAYPAIPLERYFVWIALFPALWFWPAALGKEAIVLCGVGLATLGFVGERGRPRWSLLALGVALVFAVRPQVAATFVFALVAGYWLGIGGRWTVGRVVQGTLLVVVGIGAVTLSSGAIGVQLFNPDEVKSYVESRATLSSYGGSALESAAGGVSPWLAPINTLFRPLPWEADGLMSFFAGLEVLVLWGLALRRWSEVKAFVRAHRRSRLFWMGVVFVLVYATALGMSVGNIGIIVRQRIHILPFIFMFFAGVPERRTAEKSPAYEPQTLAAGSV